MEELERSAYEIQELENEAEDMNLHEMTQEIFNRTNDVLAAITRQRFDYLSCEEIIKICEKLQEQIVRKDEQIYQNISLMNAMHKKS